MDTTKCCGEKRQESGPGKEINFYKKENSTQKEENQENNEKKTVTDNMQFGSFTLLIVSDGTFWLDGGAMFGVVPKVLWNKLNPADDLNRIRLGLNCLLIQTGEKKILVDTGVGAKLKERFKDMYRVEREYGLVESLGAIGVKPEDIDFVINTHLHFDHCGGNTIIKTNTYVPTFPNAQYIIQKEEWAAATKPNERTKASYVRENFEPLEKAAQLTLVTGEHTVVKGVTVMPTPGHTQGHQSVYIESNGKKALYCGDLIPTAAHVRLPYIMGYDLYPMDILETKKRILEQAVKEHWLLIFEHDPETPFAYIVEKEGKKFLEKITGEENA
jgi:glyoxylase-like metal-dependent hydrolase (beta-lactamase superfamily II)